jgi:uncharacterized repeat protein (TIGR03803 family)
MSRHQQLCGLISQFKARGFCCLILPLLLGLLTSSATAQSYAVIHSFTGQPDGAGPQTGLIRDAAGNLYGTTYGGGAYDKGAIFKIDRDGTETIFFSFTGGTEGENPAGGVVQDTYGNFYGAASGGKPDCGFGFTCGIVYRVDRDGKEIVLYRFGGLPDGHTPNAELVVDAAGNVYGTTQAGGDNGCNPGYGCGTVFKIDTHGRETILHTFTGTRDVDGAYPLAGLVADANSSLYGTTELGGAPACITAEVDGLRSEPPRQFITGGCGTVFKITKRGKETVLHRFSSCTGGLSPNDPVIFDDAGNLYSTAQGGSLANGLVFRLDPHRRERVLYSFSYDQGSPGGVPLVDSDGNFFGVTYDGGARYEGTVFKLAKSGKYKVLYNFTGYTDGGFPIGTPVEDEQGSLYGVARDGGDRNCGDFGCGVVFKISR